MAGIREQCHRITHDPGDQLDDEYSGAQHQGGAKLPTMLMRSATWMRHRASIGLWLGSSSGSKTSNAAIGRSKTSVSGGFERLQRPALPATLEAQPDPRLGSCDIKNPPRTAVCGICGELIADLGDAQHRGPLAFQYDAARPTVQPADVYLNFRWFSPHHCLHQLSESRTSVRSITVVERMFCCQ